MALTRTIPIRDRIFTPRSLETLLKLISDFHRPGKEKTYSNNYNLQIAENEHSTVTLDVPPHDFRPLLTTSISRIKLETRSVDPMQKIDLSMYEGRDGMFNYITIHGDDEDWVNLTHTKISKQIEDTDSHPSWIKSPWLFFSALLPLSLIFGWLLISILMTVVSAPAATPSPTPAAAAGWTGAMVVKLLFYATLFGLTPALMGLHYMRESYPSVEIRTGPRKRWKYEKRQKLLKLLGVVFVGGPSANMLWDLYKIIYSF